MEDLNKVAFVRLFHETFEKCFGFPLTSPLSETDSKLLSNKILEQTGLVIGAKSIKNYSLFVLKNTRSVAVNENPSVATLDTFARYVLNAPYTNEVQRKDNESHFPYWFQYRSKFANGLSKRKNFRINLKWVITGLVVILAIVTGVYGLIFLKQRNNDTSFVDNFSSVTTDSLLKKGWIMKEIDSVWWNKRNIKPGHLALYTLTGDNWPLSENKAGIKNLMMKRITSDCFVAEVHLTNFIPRQNWQQAGIILSEDSTFKSKMLRLSISYNDFFGGYNKPPEIIIQAISSSESGMLSKPEEIGHITLFSVEPGNEKLVEQNLANSALKIEKKGTRFRFLYTASSIESFTFREATRGDFTIQPKYISIFAIQGWAGNKNYIPACFDSFRLMEMDCDD